jgi:hypothetical protein
MKKLILVALVALGGCSMIPSRWDDNQSRAIIDIRVSAANFDCAGDQKAQLTAFSTQVQWFELYAESKGTQDMVKLNATLTETVKEYQDRLKQGPVSPMYCDLKKKVIQQQADIISRSVMGRF